MNESTPSSQHEPLAHRKLREQLSLATSQLVPNSSFSIELGGKVSSAPFHKYIEAISGFTLDNDATLGLTFNEDQKTYEPTTLELPITGQEHLKMSIYHTKYMGYMALIKGLHSMKPVILRPDEAQLSSDILDGYNITAPENTSPEAYQLWLAALLSNSAHWSVREEQQVHEELHTPPAISTAARSYPDTSHHTIVRKVTSYFPDKTTEISRSATNSFSIFETDGAVRQFDTTLEALDTREASMVRLYTQHKNVITDADVPDSGTHPESRPIALELTPERYTEQLAMLHEINASRFQKNTPRL